MSEEIFKRGLRWLAEIEPAQFQAALDELVIYGSTAVISKPDGTFEHAPMNAVMRLEKENERARGRKAAH